MNLSECKKIMHLQSSMIHTIPSRLSSLKWCGMLPLRWAALSRCATVFSILVSGLKDFFMSLLGVADLLLSQKAQYYVCQYSPAGNVDGQYS